MKSLCITGLIQDDLNYLIEVLQEAGLALSKPADRDAGMSIEYWHEQVMKLPMVRYTEDGADAEHDNGKMGFVGTQSSGKAIKSQEIGRLWEQLASDIFISNLQSESWGWADVRSAEVLPFWKRFDPQTRFLLVAVRPERFIAYHIESSEEQLDPDVLFARWLQFHQALLRFHQENRDISLLVDFEDCVSQPGAFIKTCNGHFGLGLETKHFPNVTAQDISDISRFIAAEICANHNTHQGFVLDLQASVVPVGMHHGAFRVPSATELVARYRGMKLELQHGHASLISELEQVKSELEQLQAKESDGKEENELLLAQLHQVQQELESQFLKHKEVSEQLEQLKKQPKAVEQKPVDEQQVKAQAENLKKLQQELDDLKSKYQQLVDREKDTQEENDLLLAQLHQVQEELENYFLKYQDADAKVQSLETRLNRLVSRHPDDSLVDSIEIVSVDDKPAGVAALPTLHWKVTGFEVGSELYDEIWFASFVEAGVACLMFSREGSETLFKRWPGQAQGQDQGQNQGDTVVISIVGDETTGPLRARVLKDLSGTDWQLVKALISLVSKELNAPKLLKLPEQLAGQAGGRARANTSKAGKGSVSAVKTGRARVKPVDSAQAIAAAFDALLSGLGQLPPMLHFDGLRLGYCQEEPEYEFLTFAFERAWFGDRMLPEFEFRFASVNVPAGSFGSNPRLEFHEGKSKSAFENWFEESRDDYGPKLELRFAQPNAMDMEVWDRLTPRDQSLVAALIAQLPVFIGHVQSENKSIYRSWGDWSKLADDVHRILVVSTGGLVAPDDGEGEQFEGDSLDDGVTVGATQRRVTSRKPRATATRSRQTSRAR